MLIEYFLLLLLGHVLADFYLQTSRMAEKKEHSIKWVFIHCACYWGMMLLVSLPVISWEGVLVASIAALLHLIIDIVKYLYLSSYKKKYIDTRDMIEKLDNKSNINDKNWNGKNAKYKNKKTNLNTNSSKNHKSIYAKTVKEKNKAAQNIKINKVKPAQDSDSRVRAAQVGDLHVMTIHINESQSAELQANDSQKAKSHSYDINLKQLQIIERNSFFLDQIYHVSCLFVISYLMLQNNIILKEWSVVKEFFDVVGLSELQVLTWVLALLLIHKPANIAIAKLLMIYKPKGKEDDNTYINAGRFIGTVERIIMLIFLAIGQYSAIGLVLTAKSIARYDRITKEPEFAEYYLLGTLLSTLFVILASFVL